MSLKRTWDDLLLENCVFVGGGGSGAGREAVFLKIMIMLRKAESGNKDSARNICLSTKNQKAGLRNGVVEMPLRALFFFITHWVLGLN